MSLLFSLALNTLAALPELPMPYVNSKFDNLSIVYTKSTSKGNELRVFNLKNKIDSLLSSLAKQPEWLFWKKDFSALFYMVDSKIFELEWKWNAKAKEIVSIPPGTRDCWRQQPMGLWRCLGVEGNAGSYFAQFYEQTIDKKWKKIARKPTEGCYSDSGGECGHEYKDFIQPLDTVNGYSESIVSPANEALTALLSEESEVIKNDLGFPSRRILLKPHGGFPAILEARIEESPGMEGSYPLIKGPFIWKSAQDSKIKNAIWGTSESMLFQWNNFVLIGGAIYDLSNGQLVAKLDKEFTRYHWIPTPK